MQLPQRFEHPGEKTPNINLFNNNLVTGDSLNGAIFSCHVELSKK